MKKKADDRKGGRRPSRKSTATGAYKSWRIPGENCGRTFL